MLLSSRRAGLTLLELVVVLVVLAALAGILVPLLPNLVRQSHAAVSGTNIPEINKAVQTYSALNYSSQPNRWDSLMEEGVATPYTGLPGGVGGELFTSGILTPTALTASQADALIEAGITELIDGPAAGFESATFDYPTGTVRLVADTEEVLFVDPLVMQATFNTEPGVAVPVGNYVVFGLGLNCTMVGNANGGMAEAPVHFPEAETGNPTNAYCRYVVVYNVDGERATYVGSAAIHDDGLTTAGGHLAEFYED
jgi:prepilin-type N-terminal cleavage/methylation domain-containing protein